MNPADLITHNLSQTQRAALELSGHAVMTAGAGAGKTRTLISMVVRDLVVDKVDVEDLLVCTFTRAAAANLIVKINEELARVAPYVRVDVSKMWVGTIDSICVRYLREHALAAGISPKFSVASERQLALVRSRALEMAFLNVDLKDVQILDMIIDTGSEAFSKEIFNIYERMRTLGFSAKELTNKTPAHNIDNAEILQDITAMYELSVSDKFAQKLQEDKEGIIQADFRIMSNGAYGAFAKGIAEPAQRIKEDICAVKQSLIEKEAHVVRAAFLRVLEKFDVYFRQFKLEKEWVDFLDLALLTRETIHSHDEYSTFSRVYVDEAQDTNPLQSKILTSLCATGQTMISVGDAAQSIYGFRGADVEGFRAQKNKATKIVELNENYRSSSQIVNFVNHVTQNVEGLIGEAVQMKSKSEGMGEVRLLVQASLTSIGAYDEAARSWPEIERMVEKAGYGLGDICILCRSNEDCIEYAQALKDLGVPVLLTQKKGLLRRSECKDVLSYLEFLYNPTNDGAMLRVLSSPFVGLSDEDLYHLVQKTEGYGTKKQAPLWGVVQIALPEFSAKSLEIMSQIDHLRPHQLMMRSCEKHNFDLALEILDPTGSMWRNIEKLEQVVVDIEKTQDGASLAAVLERISDEIKMGLDTGQDARPQTEQQAVQVMTVHNAKGSEFDVVVIGKMSKQKSSPRDTFYLTSQGKLGASFSGAQKADKKIYDEASTEERARCETQETEEQKRLMYVAMTRAKNVLIMNMSGKIIKAGVSFHGLAKLLTDHVLDAGWSSPEEMDIIYDETSRSWPVSGLTLTHLTELEQKIEPAERTYLAADYHHNKPLYNPAKFALLPMVSPTLSYSRLSLWKTCSLRRHLEHDLRLVSVDPERILKKPDTDDVVGELDINSIWELQNPLATHFGRKVHEYLANHKYQSDFDLTSLADSEAELERLAQIGKALSASNIAKRLSQSKIVGTEMSFYVRIQDKLVHGYIDLVAQDADGLYFIDWKTGEDDYYDDSYEFQRRLYALAMLQAGHESVESIFYHLERAGENGQSFSSTKVFGKQDNLMEEMGDQIMAILVAEPTAASNVRKNFCDQCPGLSRVCPVSQSETAALR